MDATGQHNSVRIRLITYAWGRAHIDRMLEYPLSSALAPGNLPTLSREFACEVAIVTEAAEFEYLRSHSVVRQLERICEIKLVPLDDLITEPWQYGITLAYALHRGMAAELRVPMTDMYFLFLNGDFVLADGSYERLIPHIRTGQRVILSPSYCANEEAVTAPLKEARRQDDSLAMAPRDMARLILDNRHNTIRAKTLNQDLVHFKYMDQVYWAVDDATLLGMQMPISLVAMRPEVALEDIGAFWDWGIVYDFCPSRRVTVLADSDEFLMLELRGADEHAGSVLVGVQDPRDAASRMLGYITEYQVDIARFPLVLHSRDLPDIDGPVRSLKAFRDEMLSHLPKAPIDHRGHEQWTYHHSHLFRYPVEPRREMAAVRAQIREIDARRARLVEQLNAITSVADVTIDTTHEFVRATEAALPSPTGLVGRAYRVLMGQVPAPRPWHPLFLAYRRVGEKLDAARRTGKAALLVCGPRAGIARALDSLPAGSRRMAPIEVLGEDADLEHYDTCFVEWEVGIRESPIDVLREAMRRVSSEGNLYLLVVNHRGEQPATWAHPVAPGLLRLGRPGSVQCTGSWPAWLALRLLRYVGVGMRRGRWVGGLVVAGLLALAVPLSLLALLVEGTAGPRPRVRSTSTSIFAEIRVGQGAE